MSDSDMKIKKIPYGLTDYEKIAGENYYYVDKTSYFHSLEAAGKYLFFIRPRRFGKSLLLSTMESYYDISKQDRFDDFYTGTYVHRHATEEKNKYLILKFNFSPVDPHHKKIEGSFLNNIQTLVTSFLIKYQGYLDPVQSGKLLQKVDQMNSAADILLKVINLCGVSGRDLYIIIDEYDNFANTILSSSGSRNYRDLTHGEGFFRTFFKVLKDGTTGSGAPISRLFITGVSPVTMDDVTSGFNIGKNITTDQTFNQLLGFETGDVAGMIEYYRQAGRIKHDTPFLLELMKQWYGNYLFSPKSSTTLFNADMVLYFFDEYFKSNEIPDDLIDGNVKIDYQKLRHLVIVDKKSEDKADKKEANGNFTRLREILQKGAIARRLKKEFPLEEMDEPENFVSLLFYLGLLTIKGKKEGLTVFEIPNQTAKSLYYDYIIRVSKETGLLDVNIGTVESLLHDMAYHGNWKDFFAYLSEKIDQSTSIRDFIREEKVIQGFLLAYLGISDFFIVHSEKESNQGYADIVMEPFLAVYEGIKYSYIIEIKYIPKSKSKDQQLEEKISRLKKEAEAQLNRYSGDEKLQKSTGGTTLIKLILIFTGSRLVFIDEARRSESD
jgi:hypothetical protein